MPVQQHTQTDKDSSRCGYGYEVNLNLSQKGEKRRKKSGKAANKEDIEMTMCSLSKLCPNYILPKANFHPRFVSANWIPLLQNKCFFFFFSPVRHFGILNRDLEAATASKLTVNSQITKLHKTKINPVNKMSLLYYRETSTGGSTPIC